MSDDAQNAADKAMDLFVYAPVGVALYLRDTVPTFLNLFVSRGRAELGQRRQQAEGQVAQAKALGEFAVNVGGPKVREHVEKGIAMARKSAEAVLTGVAGEGAVPDLAKEGSPAPSDATSAPVTLPTTEATGGRPATGEASNASPAPNAATLGIPDYDELSASQVVERLDGLQTGELDAVRAYEEAHRARRTILYKIEQLTS
ncbi:MAG TPA: hypothetical protein VKH36_05825 [Acidimicrobiia bacterium]|nr:hypothetical protein [Acidimicrobiia bacterium]